MMIDWKSWYFERARTPPTPLKKNLFWNEIKPGCSKKQLETIGKGVLDKPDPTMIDWSLVRSTHLYLKREEVSNRALLSALSNMTRMASKHLMRYSGGWFKKYIGWEKSRTQSSRLEVLEEEGFRAILAEISTGQSHEMSAGLNCIFTLAYYCGLRTSQVGLIRADDLVSVDGKTYLFKVGRLIELPDHVRLPLAHWIRTRPRIRKTKNPLLFKIEQRRVLSKYPKLHETYMSLRRMRG